MVGIDNANDLEVVEINLICYSRKLNAALTGPVISVFCPHPAAPQFC